MRRLRQSLDEQTRVDAAHAVLAKLTQCEFYKSARSIAVYYANDGEIGTDPLIQRAWAEKKTVCLPVLLAEKTLGFVTYSPDSELIENRYGIPEPRYTTSDLLEIIDLDLVLMPLVAFDHALFRLGMGGGYYDRTFRNWQGGSGQRLRLVGIGYELQRVNTIQPASWDVPASCIITEKEIYR